MSAATNLSGGQMNKGKRHAQDTKKAGPQEPALFHHH